MKDKDSSILATEKGAKNSSSEYNEEKPKSKPKRKKWSLRKKILVSFFGIIFIAGLYFVSSLLYSFKTERSHLIKPKNGTYTEYNVENKGWFKHKRLGKILVETYLDGKKEGLYQEWSIDGIKTAEGWFKNNEINGNWMVWNYDGKIKLHTNDLHVYFSNNTIIIEKEGTKMLTIATDFLGSGPMYQHIAIAAAADCEFYGYTDWRMPTKDELSYFKLLKKFKNFELNESYWSGEEDNYWVSDKIRYLSGDRPGKWYKFAISDGGNIYATPTNARSKNSKNYGPERYAIPVR